MRSQCQFKSNCGRKHEASGHREDYRSVNFNKVSETDVMTYTTSDCVQLQGNTAVSLLYYYIKHL